MTTANCTPETANCRLQLRETQRSSRDLQPGMLRSALVHLRDPLGFLAKRAELALAHRLPFRRDGEEAALLGEGFEGEPPAAVAFGECDAALARNAPILSAATLRFAPREKPGLAPIGERPPFDFGRL